MDQTNRPRTRGLEATEAEEDAKLIKAAMSDPSKYFKKAHQKLKNDYGRRGRDEDEEEEKLFYSQPPYDDEEGSKGVKRRRGMWRRGNIKRRSLRSEGGGGEEEVYRRPLLSARLAALLKEELRPKIVPCNSSSIEHKMIWYRLGDIVSVQKDDKQYFAQIIGFHTDQFCERYASIRWLIPKFKLFDDEGNPRAEISSDSFKTAVPEDAPVNMNCLDFIHRPPSFHPPGQNPNTASRNKYYIFNNKKHFIDSPTFTLSNADKRY